MRTGSHGARTKFRSLLLVLDPEMRKPLVPARTQGRSGPSPQVIFAAGLLVLAGCAQVPSNAIESPKAVEAPERAPEPDVPALLDALKKRCGNDDHLRNLDGIIRQLGSEEFKKRAEARENLVGLGAAALPALYRARTSNDPEIRRTGEDCAARIEEELDRSPALPLIGKLLRSQPAGTVEALVRYLPYAEDGQEEEAIYFGLSELLGQKEEIDPSLWAALQDPFLARRALAGCLVGARSRAGDKSAVHKLLRDPCAEVRLRAAQGLLAANDKAALPVLIALLEDQDSSMAWQAEELLHYFAGHSAPECTVGRGASEQKRTCRTAWDRWFQERGKSLDRAQGEALGWRPLLVLGYERPAENARLFLFGSDSRPRWEMEGFQDIRAVQLLDRGRLLVGVASCLWLSGNGIVSHVRELEVAAGRTVWEYKADQGESAAGSENAVQSCCRCANGNTLVLETSGIVELSAEGKVAARRERFVSSGRLSPRGRPTVLLAQAGKAGSPLVLREMDAVTGKERAHVELQEALGPGNLLARSRDDGWLLASGGKLIEINARGKKVWSAPDHGARDGQFLRSGSILAVSNLPNQERIVEVSRAGRVVWEVPVKQVKGFAVCFPLLRVGFRATQAPGFDLDITTARIDGLQSPNVLLRRAAARYFQEKKKAEPEAVQALLRALEDTDLEVRTSAASCLMSWGPIAMPELVERLRHPNEDVREGAARVVAHFAGKGDPTARAALPVFLSLFKDPDSKVRVGVIQTCRFTGVPIGTRIDLLIPALDDASSDVRLWAAKELEDTGAEARRAVPALLEKLRGEDKIQAHQAASALGAIAPGDPTVLKRFIEVLETEQDGELRAGVIKALRRGGAKAHPARTLVLKALEAEMRARDRSTSLLNACIDFLEALGQETGKESELLRKVLEVRRYSSQTKWKAVRALGTIRPVAKGTVTALVRLLADPHTQLSVASEAAKQLHGLIGEHKEEFLALGSIACNEKHPYRFTAQRLLDDVRARDKRFTANEQ
jgi:HEAT repeat protein